MVMTPFAELINGSGSEKTGQGRHDDVAQPARQVEQSVR
jgi:hypothetical protein